MEGIMEIVQTFALEYGLKIVGSILIVVIGRWAAGKIANWVESAMNRAGTDQSLIGFGKTLAYYVIVIFTVVAALQNLGVQTTSMVALVGAAGLAIGLALEGALANFAAGVMLLIFRPFKVGDLVEVAGIFGHVEDLLIFSTIIKTPDHKTTIIPNSQVTGAPITNWSSKGVVRLEMVFGIGYDDDLLKAKGILKEILEGDDRVAENPPFELTVLELADSSVNFAVRPYVTPDDYWGVYFDTTEQVKLRFDAAGISIPYPQTDVHLHQMEDA